MSSSSSSSIPSVGSTEWLFDASPWYDFMRQSTPVFYSEEIARRFGLVNGLWNVFKYSDVEHVLTQFREFSSEFVVGGGYDQDRRNVRPFAKSMIATDPPLHTKLRNVVSKAFTPSSIASLEPRIEEITDGLLNEVSSKNGGGGGRKRMDVITDLSEPLPVTVIAEMLGIPAEDRKKFKKWSDELVTTAPTDQSLESRMQRQRQTTLKLDQYFGQIIEDRRKHPKQDLISSIVTSEVDGQRLSDDEVLSFCGLLLVAGNETTTNLIGNAMQLFAKYDGTLKKLHENPSLVPSAIEEVLRHSSPVRGMFRGAVTDTELSGETVKAGQPVMAWIGSANRDESKFADPDHFDIERKPNPHIAFGHGIHACIGAPLARLEARVALGSIVERFSDDDVKLRVKEEELEPVRSMVLNGVRHLPIEFI